MAKVTRRYVERVEVVREADALEEAVSAAVYLPFALIILAVVAGLCGFVGP